uniref:G-protein coupled receptors family 1 profile domain-containing protein n=1 Tax=Haemonchus contortus TaxID=6289 RepID=A0A912M5Z2_HAECO
FLSIALHAITLYLVVLMAYIRYRAMRVVSSEWLKSSRSIFTAIVIAICVFVLCIPTLLSHDILARPPDSASGRQTALYSIGFSEMVLENGCFLMKGNLWLTGIFLKAIPCVLLFWFTIALIGRMKENKEKRKKLLKSRDDKGKRDVTTYMLVFMVTVFLITELPQGIMAVLNAIYTSQFHSYVYLSLADVLDLLSLINCYVAFLVYICTCSRYRQTLLSILPNMPAILSRHNSLKREKLSYATLGVAGCSPLNVVVSRSDEDQLL